MTADINAAFFKQPFKSLQSEARLVEYTVLDVEPTSPRGAAGKGQQQQQQQQERQGGRHAWQAAALLVPPPPPPPLLLSFWLGLLLSGLTG